MTYETLILNLSYFAIFVLMILVGIFGIFPPSKIIYVVSGFFAFEGRLDLYYIILFGSFGHTLGNLVQYLMAKRYGFKVFDKLKFIPKKEIKKFQIAFNKKKYTWLFFGKILDPIKLFISICAAFAKIPIKIFIPFMFLGSFIWALIFTLIGYFGGESFEKFGWIGLLVVLLGGVVIFSFYKYMNSSFIEEEVLKN